MTRALVLGASGAMGSFLCPRLADRGWDVVATSRAPRRDVPPIRWACGDAMDPEFLFPLLKREKPDAVVDFMSYSSTLFAERVRPLLESTAHYVFISSCRVFAGEDLHTERSPRLLDVSRDSAYLATDEYALAKARSENLLRASPRSNWTIVRPCIAYASPRFQFGALEAGTFVWRALRGIPSAATEPILSRKTTMIWAGDVAEMIARLLGNPAALGDDFNAASAESHSWGEIAGFYRDLIGLSLRICSTEDYVFITGNPFQVKLGRMVHHVFDNAKVLAATGLRQSDLTDLRSGLARELETLARNPDALPFDLERNARMDRVLKTRCPFRANARSRLRYARILHPWINALGSLARWRRPRR